MLRARLVTAAVAIPLLLVLIFAAPAWLFAAFVATLAVLGMAEYVGMAFPERPGQRRLGLALGSVVAIAATAGAGPGLPVVAALSAAFVIGLVAAALSGGGFARALGDLGLILVGLVYVGVLLPHFVWLREMENGPAWVFFVLVVGMAGDTTGYFSGRALGRHKLAPRVSPGKTVEGAAGILLGSVIGGAAAKTLLPAGITWSGILFLAVCMGILGQLGDLSESLMKRSFETKESGGLFPGHGGVLDRIDSLLFPVVVMYYYLHIGGSLLSS